ncbi:MAG: ATP-binding protein [Myxococcota bacterium]|nr:ATP-binding protein [Myxococcota bacterium]
MTEVPDSLADQALSNLVNQFARPLDFLRELVQNSIDAGAPRVEVWLRWQPDRDDDSQGVLEIHVDDSGEGMDERIIDEHLTRLFSSSKEDDLTKIGKFGIGFTSIFAIQPEAVLLRTGRHGESWELLFHPDRSFDKVRIQEPVSGTQITLFKHMAKAALPGFVRDCRWILGWWCEHSDTPVSFWDRSQERPRVQASDLGADPFAAFADDRTSPADAGEQRAGPQGPEQVNRPLALETTLLSESRSSGRIQVVVGLSERPRYAFYNGGLTLLNTGNPEVLGAHAPRLGHLGFKLKSDALEHTLTRDNVIQDGHWAKAMQVLLEAAEGLRERLLTRCEEAVRAGEDLAPWHRALTREVTTPKGRRWLQRHRQRALFRDSLGRPLTLDQIQSQERDQGAVLYACEAHRLAEALESIGVRLLAAGEDTRALLTAAWEPPLWVPWDQRGRVQLTADELYLIPDLTPEASLDEREHLVFSHLRTLLQDSVGSRLRLMVGDFGGVSAGARGPVALEGPGDGQVFQRPETRWLQIPAFLRGRSVLLNRNHPSVRLFVTAGAEALEMSVLGLAQLLLHHDGLERESVYDTLLLRALDGAESV